MIYKHSQLITITSTTQQKQKKIPNMLAYKLLTIIYISYSRTALCNLSISFLFIFNFFLLISSVFVLFVCSTFFLQYKNLTQ